MPLATAAISVAEANIRTLESVGEHLHARIEIALDVRDRKQGYGALDERARTDLGRVGSNETFFQVLPSDGQSVGAPVPTAPGPAAAPAAGTPTHTAAR